MHGRVPEYPVHTEINGGGIVRDFHPYLLGQGVYKPLPVFYGNSGGIGRFARKYIPGGGPATGKPSLFEQRLAAGKQLLEQKGAVASIQLFYSEEVKQQRIEGFLRRANGMGKLPEIYLLPEKFGGKDGLRVLYGAYPSVDAARNAANELPQRYREAFTTSIYTF